MGRAQTGCVSVCNLQMSTRAQCQRMLACNCTCASKSVRLCRYECVFASQSCWIVRRRACAYTPLQFPHIIRAAPLPLLDNGILCLSDTSRHATQLPIASLGQPPLMVRTHLAQRIFAGLGNLLDQAVSDGLRMLTHELGHPVQGLRTLAEGSAGPCFLCSLGCCKDLVHLILRASCAHRSGSEAWCCCDRLGYSAEPQLVMSECVTHTRERLLTACTARTVAGSPWAAANSAHTQQFSYMQCKRAHLLFICACMGRCMGLSCVPTAESSSQGSVLPSHTLHGKRSLVVAWVQVLQRLAAGTLQPLPVAIVFVRAVGVALGVKRGHCVFLYFSLVVGKGKESMHAGTSNRSSRE